MYHYNHPSMLQAATTDSQRQALEALDKTGGNRIEAAKLLGIRTDTISKTLKRIADKAAKLGYSPDHNVEFGVPDGYAIKGTSTMIDAHGNKKLQWIKTTVDWEKQQEIMKAAIEGLAEDLPKVEPVPAPLLADNTDIIPWFNIGDAHLGMLAHVAEVGHNFDLRIGERELLHAMKNLIDRASDCGSERCVIQDMGDFTHYENMSGVTEASGHALDTDGRFPKMIKTYVRCMRAIVDYALEKFQYVDVIINQGNHSRTNDMWMATFLRSMYEKEPRLHVLDNDSVFIGYRMGNTFVMSHHSDKCKPQKLVDVMATDYRVDFGEAKYKYIDIGHIHHKSIAKEYGDVIIESFNQLAPADKYAHDGGWRSRSFLTCVLRSKSYGEVGRLIVTAEQVKDELHHNPNANHVDFTSKTSYRV